MIQHTQTIFRLLPTNCLSVFDHFIRLSLIGLKHIFLYKTLFPVAFYAIMNNDFAKNLRLSFPMQACYPIGCIKLFTFNIEITSMYLYHQLSYNPISRKKIHSYSRNSLVNFLHVDSTNFRAYIFSQSVLRSKYLVTIFWKFLLLSSSGLNPLMPGGNKKITHT